MKVPVLRAEALMKEIGVDGNKLRAKIEARLAGKNQTTNAHSTT